MGCSYAEMEQLSLSLQLTAGSTSTQENCSKWSFLQGHDPFHRSGLSNLLVKEKLVTRLMDEGHTVHLVYIDSVSRRFLMAKLESFSIVGNVLDWSAFYLTRLLV